MPLQLPVDFTQSINLAYEAEYHVRSVLKDVGAKGKDWQIVRNGAILSIQSTGFVPVLMNGMPDYSDPMFQPGDRVCMVFYDPNSRDDFEDGEYMVYHLGGYASIATAQDIGGSSAGSAWTSRTPEKTISPVSSATGSRVAVILEDQSVTDVRVWGPGFDPAIDPDATNPANRDVCAKVAEYVSRDGFVRTSDVSGVLKYGEGYWQRDANGNPSGMLTRQGWLVPDIAMWQPEAGNHKRLDDLRQSRDNAGAYSGMSLARLCDIADACGRDLWWTFCIGYTPDEFATCLQYLWSRYGGTGRKVRLEAGLEPWNPDLPTWRWIEYMRYGTGLSNARYFAQTISAFMAQVNAIDPGRMVFDFYLGGHSRNPGYLAGVYEWLTQVPDSIGVAYYFGPSPSQIAQWNSDPPNSYPQTYQEIIQAGDDARISLKPRVEENIAQAANYASAQGVPTRPFVIYEAGWSFYAPAVLQAMVNEANLSPEMGQLYDAVVADMQSLDIDEVCWYKTPDPIESSNGSWGHGRSFFGPEWNDIRAARLRSYIAPDTRPPLSARRSPDPVRAPQPQPRNEP